MNAFTSLPPPAPLVATSARVVRFVRSFVLPRGAAATSNSLPHSTTSPRSVRHYRPHYSRPPALSSTVIDRKRVFSHASLPAAAGGRGCVPRETFTFVNSFLCNYLHLSIVVYAAIILVTLPPYVHPRVSCMELSVL